MKQLSRFHKAQTLSDEQGSSYEEALREIQNGKKTSSWIWYIFPQIEGLGHTEISRHYAIQDIAEAKAYLCDEILRNRLNEISQALLDLNVSDAVEILGAIDAMKLKSSMTLFSIADSTNSIYVKVLNQFFDGAVDEKTIERLK